MKRTTDLVALDLFAGAGGWDVAARSLGIDARGVELMLEAVETRARNGMSTIFRDVWHGLDDEVEVPEHAMLIASPPCQKFSMAGKGAGRSATEEVLRLIDERAYLRPDALRAFASGHADDGIALVLSPLAYIARYAPSYVALEQVPPVLPIWQRMAVELEKWGYSTEVAILNAEQYGVPQTRRRAVLVARADGVEARMPTPTHSRYYSRDPKRLDAGVLPWVSMAEALGWGLTERPSPTITGGGTETGGAEPIAKLARYTSRDDFLPNGGDASWVHNRPSPTIVGSFRPDIVAAPGYRKPGDPPRQKTPGSVRITPAEASILQSFPDGYQFAGSKSKQFLQIGNAVPPLLAHAVLEALTRRT